jgi:hypothetical protein
MLLASQKEAKMFTFIGFLVVDGIETLGFSLCPQVSVANGWLKRIWGSVPLKKMVLPQNLWVDFRIWGPEQLPG